MADSFYNSTEADDIRGRLKEYIAQTCQRAKHGEPYACPYCNSGNGSGANSDSAFHINENNTFHCFACGESGDIFDLIRKNEGLTGGDIITRARELYGTSNNYSIKAKKKSEPVKNNIDLGNFEGDPFENAPAVWTDTEIIENKAENTDRHINTPISDKNADMGKLEGTGEAVSDSKDSETAKHAAEPENKTDFTPYLIKCHAEANKTDYFEKRGFTKDIINRFSLGYDEYYNGAVIPYNAKGSYYVLRYINPTNGIRFFKPKKEIAGSEPIFNPTALYSGEPVFVFEGQLDALSVIQAGGNAIAIGGTNGKERLERAIKAKKPANTLIISMDPDEPGEKAYKKIAEMLTAANINFIKASYSYDKYNKPVKDANDMLQANADILAQDMRRNVRKAWTKRPFRPFNVKDYLNSGAYSTDINYFKDYKDRKTGFKNIDKHLTLYPGLAALGGSASLGKTTFAVNLCDNLMNAGETILYFALEQEPIELVTKLLAAHLYTSDNNTTITNFDIKSGATCEALERIKADYAEKADKFNIIRCNFTTTAEDIKEYIVNYIQATNIRPIVVIDYLQLVSPPAEFKGDVRTATDHVIKVLKTLQVENDLFVLMISNFNRSAYNCNVSYESFKETGMIEFTCDYVWALQLAVMESDSFYIKEGGRKETKTQDRNNIIFEENKKNPKNVCFVSLKSRNGRQCYKCFFKYFMQHDIFIPDYNSEYDKESEAYKAKFAQDEQDRARKEALKGFKTVPKKKINEIPFEQQELKPV